MKTTLNVSDSATPRLRDSAKLLILTDWFHPGYKAGGPIRSIVNLVNLLAKDYEIYILTSDRDHGDQEAYEGITPDKWIDYDKKARVKYLSGEQQNYKSIRQNIRDIQPDFLYLNSMFSKVFSIYPVIAFKKSSHNTKVILAPRGMLQAGALQFKSLKKKLFLFILKLTGKLNQIHFQATDLQEKKDILYNLKVNPTQIHEIGNTPGTIHEVKKIEKEVNDLKLIFVSRIAEKKNLLFFLEILSKISSFQKITFTICGAVEDEEYWGKCKALINRLNENIKVEFKGAVLFEKILVLLQTNHVFVLPSYGENFGHSIFESLSAGRPVIISDQTPWKDLESKKAGWDIPLNQSQKFQQAIEQVCAMDQKEYDQWSEGAKAVADEYIASANLKEKYKQLFSLSTSLVQKDL